MRLFLKKLLFLFVTVGLVIILPAIVIDPYNVFHWDNIKANGIEPNRNYIKMRYLLSRTSQYDALLFGSSRVGALHVEKIPGVKAYNMTCSFGLPTQHLQNLKTLIDSGLKFKRVYLGIDNLSILTNENSHRTYFRCSYEYLKEHPAHFLKLYTNPAQIWYSLRYYTMKTDSIGCKQMYLAGWTLDYNYKSKYDWHRDKEIIKSYRKKVLHSTYHENNIDNTLQSLKELKTVCDNNGIDLIVFTNPLYQLAYLEAINCGYLDFLRRMAKIVPFYNFSGLNSVTVNSDNFVDNAHYNAEVGDMLINVMTANKKFDELFKFGFGWYVTEENVDKLIDIIDVD